MVSKSVRTFGTVIAYLPAIPQEGRDVEIVVADRGLRYAAGSCLTRLNVRVDADGFGGPHVSSSFRPPRFETRLALQSAPRHAGPFEAGRDDRDADVVGHVRVDDRAEDHVDVRVSGLTDDGRGLV